MGNPALGFEDLPSLLGWSEAQNFNERTGYVGILPLFLASYAIAFRRCKFTKFFFSLAIGSMLVIYGVPPLPSLMRVLPILCYVSQMRLLLIVGFSVAVLAGLGWDEFSRLRTPRRTRIVAVGFCAGVGAALLCFWWVTGPQLHALDSSHWAFLRRQFLVLAGGVTAIVLLALWQAHGKAWMPMAVCFGWTAVDLLCFGTGYNPSISRNLYYPRTPAIDWLKKDDTLFRIFGGAMLPPDSAEVFGLSDARGMDFMTVRRYEELITGKAGNFIFYLNPAVYPKTFLLLNTKYVLSPTTTPLNPSYFELEYAKEIVIYRYKQCMNRALLVFDYQVEPDPAAILARISSRGFDPRQVLLLEDQPTASKLQVRDRIPGTNSVGSVRILSYEPDDIKIDASLPRPGFLLLLDTYFPGWSATVNGEPAPIHRADYNFRAVSLPAGRSTVSFAYRPQSLRIGLYLCAVGILSLGGAWFLPRRERNSGVIPHSSAGA
jgi:hypothetical protein